MDRSHDHVPPKRPRSTAYRQLRMFMELADDGFLQNGIVDSGEGSSAAHGDQEYNSHQDAFVDPSTIYSHSGEGTPGTGASVEFADLYDTDDSSDHPELNFTEDEECEDSSDYEDSIHSVSDDNDSDDEIDPLLYDGATVTSMECSIILMSLANAFNLTYAFVSMLLYVLGILLPKPNTLVKSSYHLRKAFSKSYTFKKIKYCKKCKKLIDSGQCCGQKYVSSFLTFPLAEQIKTILERASTVKLLSESFEKPKKIPNNVESIKDGYIYKQHSSFFGKDFLNISFSYYSDGVQLFKSSSNGIWPIYLNINELDYKNCFKIENTILCGIWYDGTKPDFDLLLGPVRDFFYNFYVSGMKVLVNGIERIARGMLLNGSGDGPARAGMLNMKQHNSKQGCQNCLLFTELVYLDPNNKRKNVRVYPYDSNMKLRNLRDTLKMAEEADATKKVVGGVKGSTILSQIVPNYILSMGIDYMHAICTGIMKKLLDLWFNPKFKSQSFSLHSMEDEVDKYLLLIKKPMFLSRGTRSIKSCLSFYSSSEFKNFFFYYSIPLLAQVMEKNLLNHYFLLVHSVFILNQDSIDPQDIAAAEVMLGNFLENFQLVYGKEHMNSNFHLLMHLGENVRRLGPLFVTSCFAREYLNGVYKKMVKGSRYAEEKISETTNAAQSMPSKIEKLPANSPALAFVKKLKSREHSKTLEEIDHETKAVGSSYHKMSLVPNFIREAVIKGGFCSNIRSIETFPRLQRRKLLYATHGYNRASKTTSFCIEYGTANAIGVIECFVKILLCDCTSEPCRCNVQFLAIIKNCTVHAIEGLPLNKLCNQITKPNDYLAINVKDINTMCVYMEINGNVYYSRRVNDVEVE